MVTPTRGSGIPGAPWRGCQFASVTTSGKTFVVDGEHEVFAISFQDADGALTLVTVTITLENTIVYSAVPVALLNADPSNTQAPGSGGKVTWRPHRAIKFNPSFPITIVPSTTLEVCLHAAEALRV